MSVIKAFKAIFMKEKAINEYLNMLKFKQGKMVMTGLVWVPKYFDFQNTVTELIMRKNI